MANGQPLDGRFALVTGASKGVGKGIALELGRQGCQVAVNYNSDLAGAEATVAELAALGAGGFAIRANVGVKADVESMFAAVLERFGRLDVMVNNAGVQTWKPLLELTEAEWDKVIDTNLKGAFLGTQLAGRTMKDSGGGAIVNIGSGCNKWAFPNLVDYTASKGGIEQFTKVAAVELGPYQIRVNCVAPGSVEVERTKAESGTDYAATWSKLTPLGRVGVPADIGNVVAFLASPKADFVTGQTIYVDGGLFCKPAWPY
ncbi:MAG: 3-oxoacyl-ACP reductase FabG [Bryobacterales bacterium]|nr:3-oxoacyl-ACP reductase FabG [Bryobacterales bacterium]